MCESLFYIKAIAHSMAKRILVVSHGASLYGAERSLLLLLKHMNRGLFEPLVILAHPGPLEGELAALGIRTFRIACPWWVRMKSDRTSLPRRFYRELRAVFRLCRLIRREDVDLVYTNTSVVFSGAVAAFLTRRPHVWHIREILPNNPDLISVLPQPLLFKLIRRLSRAIVVNSQASGRQFDESYTARGFHVVYNAQPVDEDENEESDSPVDPDGVEASDWLVACVGSLQKIKAPDDAIRAVAAARGEIPHIRLLLIGEGSSEFKSYLHALCDELGVSDRVTFAGFRTDVLRILSRCQALVMPSWNESFGRVLIEAMAVGTPVIAVNAGGIGEVIEDGATGYLVAPQAPEEMAERLIHLYRNPDIGKSLGAAGRDVVAKRFDVGTYVRSVEHIFTETQRDGG